MPPSTVNKPSQAYSAFGQQDVIATALQMALVAGGVANRGVVMTPHVMRTSTTRRAPWSPPTSPPVADGHQPADRRRRHHAHAGVVTNGTAARSGSRPCGTWRPRPAPPRRGAQRHQLTNDWMIAFAPANDPKVAVAVVVPNQPGSATGAEVSGPP